MFKSLRWRLQVWHALVLLVVLTSFGAIVYDLQWKTRLQHIDAELNRIMNSLRPMGRTNGRRPRNREEAPTNEGDPVKAITPPEAQRPPRERPNRSPAALIEEFDRVTHSDEDTRLYLVIWDENGEAHKSEATPVIEHPHLQAEADALPNRVIRERHGDHVYRELISARNYEGGTRNYLIGQSLDEDLAEHHHRGLLLVVMGFVILAAGTLGGGWLSSRAIRPIIEMTAIAESISAQNLSQRININETDSELGKLAKVLNGTFDRLQSAFERQQQFTGDASHELRTPLSVIATHTELALSRPRSNEDYRAAIVTCQRASKRMRSLIDALLTLARFDSGTPSLKQDRFDVEPLIQDCVELVRPLATERGIQIDCQTTSGEISGDWDRLAQVVTNLLTNAIRYNVDAGRVIVSTKSEGESEVISVVDFGIGIASDQLPRIFDRFYQVDKARSRADGSCGLGLSICKTIVEAHGGTITASSQLGVGTTIEVRLPLAKSPISSERSESAKDQLVSVAPGA